MSLVAMNTDTKERVDLTGKASGGSISWSVPSGSWKIMTFVCVLDGDPNVDYLDPGHVAKFIGMVYHYLFGFRSELSATGYMKTVQDWCTAHGRIPLLGHQDQENVKNPVGVSGDLMKSYRYQDVPGLDKIGWDNDPEAYQMKKISAGLMVLAVFDRILAAPAATVSPPNRALSLVNL